MRGWCYSGPQQSLSCTQYPPGRYQTNNIGSWIVTLCDLAFSSFPNIVLLRGLQCYRSTTASLNRAMRTISSTIMATPLPWLPNYPSSVISHSTARGPSGWLERGYSPNPKLGLAHLYLLPKLGLARLYLLPCRCDCEWVWWGSSSSVASHLLCCTLHTAAAYLLPLHCSHYQHLFKAWLKKNFIKHAFYEV